MNTNLRDQFICQDYEDAKEVNELSRAYGLSERRIAQILEINGIARRPRSTKRKKSLSQEHVRIGLHLRTHRLIVGAETLAAARDIGWSTIKLRKIEMGTTEVELLDLIDIAVYTGTPVGELFLS